MTENAKHLELALQYLDNMSKSLAIQQSMIADMREKLIQAFAHGGNIEDVIDHELASLKAERSVNDLKDLLLSK